jgi:hypothetical protein
MKKKQLKAQLAELQQVLADREATAKAEAEKKSPGPSPPSPKRGRPILFGLFLLVMAAAIYKMWTMIAAQYATANVQ